MFKVSHTNITVYKDFFKSCLVFFFLYPLNCQLSRWLCLLVCYFSLKLRQFKGGQISTVMARATELKFWDRLSVIFPELFCALLLLIILVSTLWVRKPHSFMPNIFWRNQYFLILIIISLLYFIMCLQWAKKNKIRILI